MLIDLNNRFSTGGVTLPGGRSRGTANLLGGVCVGALLRQRVFGFKKNNIINREHSTNETPKARFKSVHRILASSRYQSPLTQTVDSRRDKLSRLPLLQLFVWLVLSTATDDVTRKRNRLDVVKKGEFPLLIIEPNIKKLV